MTYKKQLWVSREPYYIIENYSNVFMSFGGNDDIM